MKIVRLLTGGVGVVIMLLSVRAMAQTDSPLPPGPNRDLVMRRCTTCHDISNLTSTVGKSRDGWNDKIDDMVVYGLEITSQERALILDYLAAYLPRE
jgi:hypothetical protein